MESTQPPPFTGSVKDLNKEPLKALAAALGLATTGVVKELRERISKELLAKPEHANDPRFRQLYGGTRGAERGAKTIVLSSTLDKAAQDNAAGAGPQSDAMTPAHKTLADLKISKAPPGQRLPRGTSAPPLPGAAVDPSNKRAVDPLSSLADDADESASDTDLAPGSKAGEAGGEQDPLPATPPKGNLTLKKPVNFAFLSKKDCHTKVEYCEKGEKLIIQLHDFPTPGKIEQHTMSLLIKHVTTFPGGETKETAKLSDILPDLISDNSPLKVQGGRLSRPGLGGTGVLAPLGSIAAILRGDSKYLKGQVAVDEFELVPVELPDADIQTVLHYKLDLYYAPDLSQPIGQPSSGSSFLSGVQPIAGPVVHYHAPPPPPAPLMPLAPLMAPTLGPTMAAAPSTTDAQASLLFTVLYDFTTAISTNREDEACDSFLQLHERLQLIEQQVPMDKATLISARLLRYLSIIQAFDILHKEFHWGVRGAGYTVRPFPDRVSHVSFSGDITPFLNSRFTVHVVYKALAIGPTQAGEDLGLFEKDLAHLPDLKRYVETVGVYDPCMLAPMKDKELKAWKAGKLRALQTREESQEFREFLQYRQDSINGPDTDLYPSVPAKRRLGSNPGGSGAGGGRNASSSSSKRPQQHSRSKGHRYSSDGLDDDNSA